MTSGRRDGTDHALAALNWMRDLYEGCGDHEACPDIVKYTTIIVAMNSNAAGTGRLDGHTEGAATAGRPGIGDGRRHRAGPAFALMVVAA